MSHAVPASLIVGRASRSKRNIHRPGQAVAEHAPFPRSRAAVEAIDGIPVVGGDIKIAVRPELNHLRSKAIAGEDAHVLARRAAELHHAVIEEARYIDGAVGSEIESRSPIKKAFYDRAEGSAASRFEPKHIVVHMAGEVDRAIPPANRFGPARRRRKLVDERAGGAVVAKHSTFVALTT